MIFNIFLLYSEAFSEVCQTSVTELFAKIVSKSLSICGKRSIAGIWQGSEYASDLD